MESEIKAELADIKHRIIRIERYMFWTAVITIALVVLPLLGLAVAVPKFMQGLGDIQSIGF